MEEVRQDLGGGRSPLHIPGHRRHERARTPWPRPRLSTRHSILDGVILTKLDGDARGGAAL